MAQFPVDQGESIVTHVAAVWVEAGVEPAYTAAMHSLLLSLLPLATMVPDPIDSPSWPSLAGLCCESAGGMRQRAEWIETAWYLLYAAAHLLDSIEDEEDTTDLADQLGAGAVINVTTGLIITANFALNALEDLGVDWRTAQTIRNDFCRVGLKMCAVQHADLVLREPTLEECWQVAEAKSAAFFALDCRAGARMVSQDAGRIDRFGEYGRHLGILVQIGDDAGGLWSAAGEPGDLVTGRRWTLPMAYAMKVLPAQARNQLRHCLQAAPTDAAAEAEAHQRIIESGALVYLAIESERHRRQAETALCAAAPPSSARDKLLWLLDKAAPLGRT